MKHGVPCDFEHPDVIDEIQQVVGAAASVNSPTTTAATPHTPATPATPSAVFTPAAAFDYQSPAAHHAPSPAMRSATPLCRSPSTPTISAATPPDQRMLELRLMHHYTAITCKTFTFSAPMTEDIWKFTVPSLAFSGSQHLADAVLAVTALHLRSMSPNDRDMIRASHAYMAASLAEYNATLNEGINQSNAEALFLTSTLIAFQATATRTFIKDEPGATGGEDGRSAAAAAAAGGGRHGPGTGGYAVPFSWFHSFQGVKAITAASWRYLRHSSVVAHIINSQAALQLDFEASKDGFFGHLLDGLDEELAAMDANASFSGPEAGIPPPASQGMEDAAAAAAAAQSSLVDSTRQAYQHAVAALNWAHKLPHKGAALSFPATVSRRFVELLEERRPRALAVLACFFAQLKSLESVWWLQGMARREVLGVVGLFNGDYFGADAHRTWWPHLEWAARIAVWHDGDDIPPEVWGADWQAEEQKALAAQGGSAGVDFVSQIEMLSQMAGPAAQSLPVDFPGP